MWTSISHSTVMLKMVYPSSSLLSFISSFPSFLPLPFPSPFLFSPSLLLPSPLHSLHFLFPFVLHFLLSLSVKYSIRVCMCVLRERERDRGENTSRVLVIICHCLCNRVSSWLLLCIQAGSPFSFSLCLPSLCRTSGIIDTTVWFYLGSWDPNSGPPACASSTFPLNHFPNPPASHPVSPQRE